MVAGGFNNILNPEEKIGCIPTKWSRINKFVDCLHDCILEDLGYYGPTFTCCNRQFAHSFTCSRLDRTCTNSAWLSNFPFTKVRNLANSNSDHTALLVGTNILSDKPKNFSNLNFFGLSLRGLGIFLLIYGVLLWLYPPFPFQNPVRILVCKLLIGL